MTAAVPSAPRRRLSLPGWDEGDVWTVGIGLLLALTLAVSTIPAVLDARDAVPLATSPPAQAPPQAAAPAAAPPAVALPEAPVTQPLLGPLVPLAPVGPAPVEPPPAAAPVGAPPAGSPGPLPLAPGEVRAFAALPADGMPGAVTGAADGGVIAATDAPAEGGGAAQVLTWDASGVLTSTVAVPEQPADRTRGITALATLHDGALGAVDAATSRLLRYDRAAGSWSTLATVRDVPACLVLVTTGCQPGVVDSAPLLRGLAVDGSGGAYVADAGQGIIWRATAGVPPEIWYSSADLVGEDGVAGLAVGADGHLRAVVTRLADVQGTAAGALLRIDRDQDGSAGARTVVAAFRAGEDPVDVALGGSGSAYVALRGVSAVVTLDSGGVEQLRVLDDALRSPSALELAAGRLLVTSAGPAPSVLEIGVDDAPVPLTAGGSPRG